MRRRAVVPASAAPALLGAADSVVCREPMVTRLAARALPELRRALHDELFARVLPFWDTYGVDARYGGLMHGLDYDGTLVHTGKWSWFQGRALWVYSFLYNRFGRNPRHLATATATKDFLLRHAPQPDGWWAEAFTREGRVQTPFRGDVYGMYFAAEGLQEYAWATQNDEALEVAARLMKRLFAHINSSGFRFRARGEPGERQQGLWMVNINIARQMWARWRDPEIRGILDFSIDAVIHRHFNPDIGLNNESLRHDFSRPPAEAARCVLGHSIETLWMILEEAAAREDWKLWETCAERIRRHLDVGWDAVYGGLAQAVNVDAPGYRWPAETPVGTNLVFRFTGEYQYLKTLWALNEILVATLLILERTAAPWAARYFDLAYRLIQEKFSMHHRGLPGYGLFAGRRMEFDAHTTRQDNYHPPRQLMLNLLTLDRMIQRGGKPAGTAAAGRENTTGG